MNGVFSRYEPQMESQYSFHIENLTTEIKACRNFSDQLKLQAEAMQKSKGNKTKEMLSMIQMNEGLAE